MLTEFRTQLKVSLWQDESSPQASSCPYIQSFLSPSHHFPLSLSFLISLILSLLSFWAQILAKLLGFLFIYQLITIPPRTSVPQRIFPEQEIPKTALIWSLLCPQVLRNCLTGLLLRLHNPLYIQLEVEKWFTLGINFSLLSTSFLT